MLNVENIYLCNSDKIEIPQQQFTSSKHANEILNTSNQPHIQLTHSHKFNARTKKTQYRGYMHIHSPTRVPEPWTRVSSDHVHPDANVNITDGTRSYIYAMPCYTTCPYVSDPDRRYVNISMHRYIHGLWCLAARVTYVMWHHPVEACRDDDAGWRRVYIVYSPQPRFSSANQHQLYDWILYLGSSSSTLNTSIIPVTLNSTLKLSPQSRGIKIYLFFYPPVNTNIPFQWAP